MAKIKSFGVSVTVATTAIGHLIDVTIPEIEVSEIDVTTHDSDDGYREFIGGLKDGGTVTLSGKYDIADAGQVYLRTAANIGGTPKACVITFSDNSTATFDAVVKGYGVNNPLDEDVTFSASLRISGPITYAAGA